MAVAAAIVVRARAYMRTSVRACLRAMYARVIRHRASTRGARHKHTRTKCVASRSLQTPLRLAASPYELRDGL